MTKSTLVKNDKGQYEWIRDDGISIFRAKQKEMNTQGEDLTVDGYISKYGGIKSVMTNEVFTSKRSYADHLKSKNCVIKDW